MNQVLDEVGMVKAPDKTFIGRLSKGVDFLGYFFKGGSPASARQGLHVAQSTWQRHRDRLTRLYEQGASQEDLSEYIRRWQVWVRSGVVLGDDQQSGGIELNSTIQLGKRMPYPTRRDMCSHRSQP